jgi:hypothetical protein
VHAIAAFEVELEFHKQRGAGQQPEPWSRAADACLASARSRLLKDDVDGGWKALNEAHRWEVDSFTDAERASYAISLREEASKLGGWRKEDILKLLATNPAGAAPAVANLREAMHVRDTGLDNDYFKNGLIGDQLKVLVPLLAVVLTAFIVILIDVPPFVQGGISLAGRDAPLDRKMVLAVVLFGMVGSTMSAIISTLHLTTSGRIPEQVAKHTVTLGRALVGGGFALAAACLLQAGLIRIGNLDHADPWLTLIVAFAGGFSEQFVLKAIPSATSSAEKR